MQVVTIVYIVGVDMIDSVMSMIRVAMVTTIVVAVMNEPGGSVVGITTNMRSMPIL